MMWKKFHIASNMTSLLSQVNVKETMWYVDCSVAKFICVHALIQFICMRAYT